MLSAPSLFCSFINRLFCSFGNLTKIEYTAVLDVDVSFVSLYILWFSSTRISSFVLFLAQSLTFAE